MSKNLFGTEDHNGPTRDEAYLEEQSRQGNPLYDDGAAGEARDLAKMEKSIRGEGQKMDSADPDTLQPDRNDAMIEEEKDSQ